MIVNKTYRCQKCKKRVAYADLVSHPDKPPTVHTCPHCGAGVHLCDICLEQMSIDEGHVLTTRQVVTTPKYWEVAFRGAESAVAALPEDQVRRQYEQGIRQQCAQQTGWLTCDTCIKRFEAVDRETAKRYAADYWSAGGAGTYAPPDGEAVDPAEALPAANQAWFAVTGQQPPRTEITFSQDERATETGQVAEHVQKVKDLSKRVTDKMQEIEEKQKQHQMNVMASQILQGIAPVSSHGYQSIMAKHESDKPKPLDKEELARTLGAEWRKWRATLPAPPELAHADFRGLHLYGLDFSGANMTGARLEGAEVYACTFDSANLESARLDGASITSSSFKGAKMNGANMSKATTSKSDSSEAGIDDPGFRAPRAGCFVATACFGSPTAPEVVVLREFRDAVLMRSEFGRRLACLYYRMSPPLADLLQRHSRLKGVVRMCVLAPAVTLASRAVRNTSEQSDGTRLR